MKDVFRRLIGVSPTGELRAVDETTVEDGEAADGPGEAMERANLSPGRASTDCWLVMLEAVTVRNDTRLYGPQGYLIGMRSYSTTMEDLRLCLETNLRPRLQPRLVRRSGGRSLNLPSLDRGLESTVSGPEVNE